MMNREVELNAYVGSWRRDRVMSVVGKQNKITMTTVSDLVDDLCTMLEYLRSCLEQGNIREAMDVCESLIQSME